MRVTLLLSFSVGASLSLALRPPVLLARRLLCASRAVPSMSSSATIEPQCFPQPNRGFVDVHAHLLHEKFQGREREVARESIAAGLDYVVINGIEPVSNREILAFCAEYPQRHMLPACGIYPLDAACNAVYSEECVEAWKREREAAGLPVSPAPLVNWRHSFPPPARFDVDAEVDFLESLVRDGRIVALGECGLDKHYLTDEASFAEQERVLRRLMRIASKYDVPIILHTRKAEKRVLEMLIEENVRKADFHCFCGKLKLGLEIAAAGYYLSIPSGVANSDPNSSFKKLAAALPLDKILTETDSPYMGPVKGEDNTPATVPQAVETIARLRGVSTEEMTAAIRENFRTLFGL